MNMKKGFGTFFLYLFLSVSAFLSIFPFIWIVLGSTNSAVDIQTGKLSFGDQLGVNLKNLFGQADMGGALFNSAKIAVLTVVLSLLVTSMAAYGFQMYKSRVREKTYSFFLLTMMIPFASLMIPLFQIIVVLRLLNSHTAIILVGSISVFMIFFFRQSFVNYQTEILQAARVDGAGEFRIFFTIFFPSMKSTYAAGAIYAFMTSWNAYIWPLIVLQSNDKRTSTLLISSLSSSYTPDYGVIMTGIALATLPVIIVFFAFQKQFVQGMVGSVKQ
ncbi:carbohydrate ABC transporter permease [uncultured Sphaerochaeta sp.]|uniref:carbohydrate ABC transporter permease n=1 Tax=uncultured Sphaerochaeta sp. TaxID=886478 RepID=UPI002A0A12D1|nr:carbohydrate ABC transporter permease [uncultured Sphaerochaeta sp.]